MGRRNVDGIRSRATDGWTETKGLVDVSLTMLTILDIFSLPMAFLVYKFIQRRCGDVVKHEDQFAVTFHTSSSSRDGRFLSEWEVDVYDDVMAEWQERGPYFTERTSGVDLV